MRDTTRDAYEARLLRVLMHIQNNLDRPLPLEELAGVAAFSPFHFSRIFRAMIGETVGEYIRRLRLERAAGALQFTSLPVTQIAMLLGSDSPEAFARAFKALFGMPPSHYRAKRGVHRSRLPAGPTPVSVRHRTRAPFSEPIRVVRVPAIETATLRHVGPYNNVRPTFQSAIALADQAGLRDPEAPTIMLTHDDPNVTDLDKLRADAGVVLADPGCSIDGLSRGVVSEGLYVVALHRGPYTGLAASFEWLLAKWLPGSGYEADDRPSVELYFNSPDEVPESDLRTEVRLPVRKV